MKNSNIEWCDHTFNPWEGCTKVSPGCANCYAETRNARFGGGTAVNWGKGAPRRRTSASNWNQPVKWNAEAGKIMRELHNVSRSEYDQVDYERPRVFCASLADWLDDEVPIEWLADLLDLVRRTPNLDWLLLTKRPENCCNRLGRLRGSYYDMCRAEKPVSKSYTAAVTFAEHWLFGASCLDGTFADYKHGETPPTPPANVWIGTTVEDQARADERIPHLLSIPARVRFLSCEPLLGPVEFSDVTKRADCVAQLGKPVLHGIDWVICGGESGPKARPMHPDWARSLRDRCDAAGVPFLFKQWGEWIPLEVPADANAIEFTVDGVNKKVHQAGPISFANVGKRTAGRLLDGIEHNGFPGGAA